MSLRLPSSLALMIGCGAALGVAPAGVRAQATSSLPAATAASDVARDTVPQACGACANNTRPESRSPLASDGVCTAADFARSRLAAQAAAARVRLRAQRDLPMVMEADRVQGRPDKEATAQGSVRAEQGETIMRSDSLHYDNDSGIAHAEGHVRIDRAGDRFTGSEFQLQVQRFEGYVLDPSYHFALTNAGGRAQRIDFVDEDRSSLTQADYTSCPREGGVTPSWLLRADRVDLDFSRNEGTADGAVLEFLGVPILAAPVLRFPLSEERKSGWLPPSINIDNRKGLELGVPYYWNIAPNIDATLTPTYYSKLGPAIDGEFRYLSAPGNQGELQTDLLPHDRLTGDVRYAVQWTHRDADWFGYRLGARVERVSDDSYWKDFPRQLATTTPRLLTQDLSAVHALDVGVLEGSAYARVLRWQVIQDADPSVQIVSPYQRSPQLGWRATTPSRPFGLNVNVEAELNRFTRPDPAYDPTPMPEGWRAHLLASVAKRWGTPGWWIEPGFKLNLAAYRTDDPMSDGSRNAKRAIPTASLDAGMSFERDSTWFGHGYRQTLEPRVRYVDTPYRNQTGLPNYDSAGTDFNVVSIFADNAFSGIDRVSDAHQVTAGVTSRWIDADTGAEKLRVGAVQRYLLRDQLVTPDGVPITQRFSDVLLFGDSSLLRNWALGAAIEYSPETSRVTRSVLSTRYNPAPFHTISVGYRYVKDSSEQIDLGWQWPLFGDAARMDGSINGASRGGSGGACKGTLYTVGRINYSKSDARVTDSLLGFEYDAGCWVGRIVAERLSTGRSEATTRLLLQLELVGLSRLGSNPLKPLKDNIPGYQLLRDDTPPLAPPSVYE